MPRYPAAGQQQAAPQAARPSAPPIPEWQSAEPPDPQWSVPPVVTSQPAYEPPPTGFESAPPPPPPMRPRTQVPVAPVEPDNTTAPTPTINDLFGAPPRMAPAAPAPAAAPAADPFAFLPPPRAADRTDAIAADDGLDEPYFDSDPELTMIASRRGKTKFWTLDLPDGSVEVVLGSVVIGRAATPVPGRPGARLLSIADPTRSLSKNHAVFTDEHGVLLVEDLGSMNGILVTRADGHQTELVPGMRHRLDNGSTVELGDVQLTVYKN